MKKYCILLACIGTSLVTSAFANWDSLSVNSIKYDTTTCTLSMVRTISDHHADTYQYIVRGPVAINIPLQSASGAGSNWSISATTYLEYLVPKCDLSCSAGVSPVPSTISAFSVTGKNGAAPYTYTLAGFDRNIYVTRKTSILECSRCPENTYWCPSANSCLNQGEICDDHMCNDDTICDINEGCGCPDCDTKQDHCQETLVCKYDYVNPNNSRCVGTDCGPGKYWCPETRACIADNMPCGDTCLAPLIFHNNKCIVNGSCLPGNKCCPIGTYFYSPLSKCIQAGQTAAV